MKTKKLNNNIEIPVLGFGTWQITGEDCTNAVSHALSVGYRHIDTADAYGNHAEVGKAIANSGVARSDIFLTTKVFRNSLEYKAVHDSAERFLQELQTDYIDLLLVHWPNKEVAMQETMRALLELKEKGSIRAIGVSNFTTRHIDEVLSTDTPICMNQIEVHPYFNQRELRAYCAEKHIAVTAYSPLGRGEVLEDALIAKLAEKYQATPAQIILAWVIARDMIAIPKSTNPDRIEKNFESLDLKMSEEDLQLIDVLPQGDRLVCPGFNEFDH